MDIDINYQNSYQNLSQEELDKLLIENVQAGNIQAVDLLLEKGANIETRKAILSMPPLSLAINLKEEDAAFAMADFLIKKGADIHGVNRLQHNALHHAAASGYIKVIELLIQNGADVRASTKRGDKPIDTLLAAAPYTDWTTLSDNEEAFVRFKYTLRDWTTLSNEDVIAICKRRAHTVYRLFSELTITELEAYRLGNGKEYLVDFNQAKLNNRKSMAKEIPLALNKLLLLKQLLPIELGGMITQLDLLLKLKEALPAWYHHRIEKDLPDAYQIAIQNYQPFTPKERYDLLVSAIISDDIKTMTVLLGYDMDLNSCENRFNKTPLMITCIRNDVEMSALLLKHGADINAVDKTGGTALQYAATSDDSALIIHFLVEKGADVKAADQNGVTALHYAAMLDGSAPIIDFLVINGANVNAFDQSGYTPLNYSVQKSLMNPVETLIKHGANVLAQPSQKSFTPIGAAAHIMSSCLSRNHALEKAILYRLICELSVEECDVFSQEKYTCMSLTIQECHKQIRCYKQRMSEIIASPHFSAEQSMLFFKEKFSNWYHHRLEQDFKLICEDRLTQQKKPVENIIFEQSIQQSPTVLFSSNSNTNTSGHKKRKAEADLEENKRPTQKAKLEQDMEIESLASPPSTQKTTP